jgi:glycosyltransferase involved in cell wall biosynthesis
LYRARKIGISVPAHNEEELITATLSGIPDFVDRIYVCNDASTDRTREKVEEFMKADKRVVLIDHDSNTGVGGAIIDCHKVALEEGMEIIAVMAGDDQMDPTRLPQLLDPLVEGKSDYTKGNRLYQREALQGMSRWRFTGNFILTLFSKFATGNWDVSDPQNGYTAITADALRKLPLDLVYRGYLFENDMLVKLNANHLRIMDIPIPARYKNENSGINYYSFITKGMLFLVRAFLWRMKVKYMVGYLRPQKVFHASGLLLLLLGSLASVALVVKNIIEHRPVYHGLITSLLLAALGAMLLFFGIYHKKTPQDLDMERHET